MYIHIHIHICIYIYMYIYIHTYVYDCPNLHQLIWVDNLWFEHTYIQTKTSKWTCKTCENCIQTVITSLTKLNDLWLRGLEYLCIHGAITLYKCIHAEYIFITTQIRLFKKWSTYGRISCIIHMYMYIYIHMHTCIMKQHTAKNVSMNTYTLHPWKHGFESLRTLTT